MCVITGTAAAVIGTVLTIASTAVGVVGSIQKGNAEKAQYNYKAQVNKNNAIIANNNAATERQAGLEDSRLQRIKTLQRIGSQQAGMAAGNIDVTQGIALDTVEDTATMGELDALNIQYNAEKRALNYEQQADNFTNQANMDIIAGKNASKAGKINAVAIGLEGVGKAFTGLSGTEVPNKVSSWWNGQKLKFSNKNKIGMVDNGLKFV